MADDARSDGLGPAIAERARPRLATARRLRRAGAIGMVGRSTLGFGRIIAAAGSARPTVTADSLTSLSLRPPTHLWSGWAPDEAEPAPSWTAQAAPPRHSPRPAPDTTTKPAEKPRPTTPRKVDALRRLLESRGMIEPEADVTASPAAPPAPSEATAVPTTTLGDRSATSAGPTTAPGELARRSRPEAGEPGGPDGLSVVFPDGPATGPDRSPRGSRTQPLDRFRSALAARGLIDDGDSAERASDTRRTPHSDAPREARRSEQRPTADANRREPSTAPSPSVEGEPDSDDSDGGDGGARAANASITRSADRLQRTDVVELGRRPLRMSLLPARSDATSHHDDPSIAPPPAIPAAADHEHRTVIESASAPGVVRRDAAPSRSRPTVVPATDTTSPADPVDPPDRVDAPRSTTSPTRPAARPRPTTSPAPASDGAPVASHATPARPRTDLRDVGQRVGLPHTRSVVNRPDTTISRAVQPPLGSPLGAAVEPQSPVVAATVARMSGPNGRDGRPLPNGRDGHPPGATEPIAAASTTFAPDQPAAGRDGPARARSRRVLARPGTVFRELARRRDRSAVAYSAPAASASSAAASPLTRALAGQVEARSARPARDVPATRPDEVGAASRHGIAGRIDRHLGEPAEPGPSELDSVRPPAATPVTVPESVTAPKSVTVHGSVTVPESLTVPESGSALADRFLRELGRDPVAVARPLPEVYQPLASAITPRAARISTDAATQRALRSVGKRAATVDDVIHLDRAPHHDVRAAEVIAHELTHVAHPSPTPRFFDDDHRGPEERMAEQVADVIARSPVMPAAPVPSATAPARTGGRGTIRRSPAPASSRSPGAISASELAASLSGSSGGSTIQRTATDTGSPPIQRFAATQSAAVVDDADAADGPTPLAFADERDARAWFESMINQSIEHIVRRIEARVIIDLERRGGRHWRNL